jgi:hypothetical protein
MDCALAGAQMQRGRPLNRIVRPHVKGIALRIGIYGLLASIATFSVTEMFLCPMAIVDYTIDRVRYGELPYYVAALDRYRKEKGTFPTEEQGLRPLVGEYFRELPVDPWGSNYIYRLNGAQFVLYSPGLNKIDEGGAGDDIILGPKKYRCEEYGVNCPKPCETVQMASILFFPLCLISLIGSFFMTPKSRDTHAA